MRSRYLACKPWLKRWLSPLIGGRSADSSIRAKADCVSMRMRSRGSGGIRAQGGLRNCDIQAWISGASLRETPRSLAEGASRLSCQGAWNGVQPVQTPFAD